MSLLLCSRRRTSRAVHTYAARCCAALVRHKKRFTSAAQRQCERHHRNTCSYSRAATHSKAEGRNFLPKVGVPLPIPSFPYPPHSVRPLRSHSLPSIPSRLEVGPLNRARGTGGERCKLPSEVWAESRPPIHFCAISAQKMAMVIGHSTSVCTTQS